MTSSRGPARLSNAGGGAARGGALRAVGQKVKAAAATVGRAAYQAGGLAIGFTEKALGKHSWEATGGPYKPTEVKDPSGQRGVVVFRSNQAESGKNVGTFLQIAKDRGASPSQVVFINLRAEKNRDAQVIKSYRDAKGLPAAAGPKQVTVKMIDNAPPAFYLGNVGWQKAVDKIGEVYRAVKDPSVKVAVIHCEQGRGRTGTVVATAVRIAIDGMSGKQALQEAKKMGLTMPWQKAFILRFAREWQAGKIHFDSPQGSASASAHASK
jgi:hypothetical protein